MYTVTIVVSDNILVSALAGICDVFALSNKLLGSKQAHFRAQDAFNVIIASEDGSSVIDNHGNEIEVETNTTSTKNSDAIILPGSIPGCCMMSASADAVLQAPFGNYCLSTETRQWLIDQHKRGAFITALNSDTFLLAESGLLDSKRCAICNNAYHLFTHRYPLIKTEISSTYIEDNSLITAQGLFTWVEAIITVILSLVDEKNVKYLSSLLWENNLISDINFYFKKKNNKFKDPFLIELEKIIIKENYSTTNVKKLAISVFVSERTLSRRIKKLVDMTPKAFIDYVSINHSCILLKTTNKQIKEIALSLGYSSDIVFRRLFYKINNMTPSDYRAQNGMV